MALSNEDKKDVKGAMGKALANKVAKVTRDSTHKVGYPEHISAWEKKHSGGDAFKRAATGLAKRQVKEYTGKKSGSFTTRLEAHKAEGKSFDDGTWKPKKKGESFIQALERHKSRREFD